MAVVRVLNVGGGPGPGPGPDTPALPNTYDPPRIDAARSGWNHYFPASGAQLRQMCAGTGITRPAVLYLDKTVNYEADIGAITVEPMTGQDTDWLYIMPLEADYAQLSPEGTRIDPATHAANMPKISRDVSNYPCFNIAPSVKKVRVVGIEIVPGGSFSAENSLFYIGRRFWGGEDTKPTSESELPQEIVVDRCWVHGAGDPNWGKDYRNGISVTAKKAAIVESVVEHLRSPGETHAIDVPWASGQITVWNNRLDASISFLTGGTGDLWVDGQHEDIDIRWNESYKAPEFDDTAPEYVGRTRKDKNHFELKGGVRVLIDSNWSRGQYRVDESQGHPQTMKNNSQSDTTPWKRLEDITIRWNESRDDPKGFLLTSADGSREVVDPRRIAVYQNLFVASREGGTGVPSCGTRVLCYLISPYQPAWNPTFKMYNVHLYRNTFIGCITGEPAATAHTMVNVSTHDSGGACEDLKYYENVSDGGSYGWRMADDTKGDALLEAFADPYEVRDNVCWNCQRLVYLPTGVTNLASIADVGFAQTADPDGSWKISGTYSHLGCDYDTLMSNTLIAHTGVRF